MTENRTKMIRATLVVLLILAVGVIIAGICSADYDAETDYGRLMKDSCVAGDVLAGTKAANSRNEKIDDMSLTYDKIWFEDLWFLSKLITAEAGSSWLPVEWKVAVGEVVINRMNSPEFPDTISDVIFQRCQYYAAGSSYFTNLVPYEDCVDAAWELLNGERVLNDPSVVFQANFPQGSGTALYMHDNLLGSTYFCYSQYPELY